MTVSELARVLQQVANTFPTAEVVMQGWDDKGDLQDFKVKGDVRMERDAVGIPVVVVR